MAMDFWRCLSITWNRHIKSLGKTVALEKVVSNGTETGRYAEIKSKQDMKSIRICMNKLHKKNIYIGRCNIVYELTTYSCICTA